MAFIPLAIIGIVILTGVVALAMGSRGWSIANIAAAWLVLLASCGFLALAGIRGQSERAWTGLLRTWEAKVLQTRDSLRAGPDGGLVPIGECSLESLGNCPIDDLAAKRSEWTRALERVDLWRGRFWSKASFDPPRPNRDNPSELADGTVTIESEANPSIAEGAELYVFDRKPPEEGGRFLGGFRVVKVDQNAFKLQPLARVDARDRELWKAPHEEVTVYENLPFDRWLAFHRTDRSSRPGVLPETAKRLPDQAGGYEPLRADLERHTFPEDLLAEDAEGDADDSAAEDADTPPSGVEWATVTFEQDFEWRPDEAAGDSGPSAPIRYRAGEKVSAFPARLVAPLRKAGATFSHAWSYPPGMRWAEVAFEQDKTFERPDGEAIEFASGATARLPLEEAERLAKEGVVTIKKRLLRRPLAAGSTALRGVERIGRDGRPRPAEAADALDVQSLGIYRLGGEVERRIGELDRDAARMKEADEAAKRQLGGLDSIKGRLAKDLGHWSADAEAAESLVVEADRRVQKAAKALDDAERRIVELGGLLERLSATLATEIGRRPPPPTTPAGG